MIVRSALDRVVSTLVVSVGVGGAFFSLLGLPGIIGQHPLLDPAYSIATIVVFCGLPPVMAALAFRAPADLLRILAGVHAAATLVFLVLWVPAMTVARLPNDELPWLINTVTVATCMAAIALPFLSAWIYILVAAATSGLVRFVTLGGVDASIAIQDTIMIVLISGFMMALLQLTLRAGREQDVAATLAQHAASAAAAAETLERQRTRYHAFTHDDVLATLLAASQHGAEARAVTRRSAERTLEKLDQFRDDPPVVPYISLGELESALRSAAQPMIKNFESSLLADPSDTLRLPVEVGDALSEAFTEALRNSIRHAGWPSGLPVRRSAVATRTARGVQIVVTDDGKGFNPRRIGLDRLGVRLSILQRVNSQAGGRATIDSARGAGTTVQLTWTEGAV